MRKFLSIFMLIALLAMFLPAIAGETAKIPTQKSNQQEKKQKAENQTKKNSEKQEEELPSYVSKSEFPISAIDPTASTNPVGAYYPGLRAGNQLIIYTSEFARRTGTNEFGREAIVVNNVVTDLTGGNSLIPKDGFVISGHGKAKKWINNNVIVGAKIKVDKENNTIESIITPESYIFKANQRIKDVQNLIAEYRATHRNYQAQNSEIYLSKAIRLLNEAQKYLVKENFDKVEELANSSAYVANYALYYAIPARDNELQGIWLRPTEKSRSEVVETLERLKDVGIENVFLETYYQGYTIFPSKTLKSYGVITQRKEFEGWDPLKVWIEEAHNRNMKVHVWFQTFYTGNEDISKNPNHVISAHPSWANVQKRNYEATKPMPSTMEHNGYFLDPANPEVQNYLLTLISEIATNYDIDGLNIDYIRYPASLKKNFPTYLETTWGYTNYARAEFISLYGEDPVNLTLDNPLWQKWVEYRQNKVSDLVGSLRSVVKNRKVLLSAVIFPEAEESSVIKLQDWKEWGNNYYVDAFTPLVMGSDKFLAECYVREIKEAVDCKVQVLPGLFEPFTSASSTDMLHQIKAVRDANASGIVIFDYAHLNKEFANALGARAFR